MYRPHCLYFAACPLLLLLPPSSCPGQTRGLYISGRVVRSRGCEEQKFRGRQGGSPGWVWEPTGRAVCGGALAAALCLGMAPAGPAVCFLQDRSQLTALQGLTARWCSPRHNTQRQDSQSCEVCVHTAAESHAIPWIYTLRGSILSIPIATDGNSPFPMFSFPKSQFR